MASSDTKKLHEVYGLDNGFTENTEFLCGVEHEIEGIRMFDDDLHGKYPFAIHEDPSLRNDGREIVTSPQSYEVQLKWFDIIHNEYCVFHPKIERYSERTSIHVHVNFSPLTMLKIAQFVRLYTLFEPYFFSLVDPCREHNIYCVPLNFTFLPKLYNTNITYQIGKWHKYTAFNLLPLSSKGTIEFRHLQGTGDRKVFETWLGTIKKVYDFNLTYNLDFSKIISDEEGIKKLFKDIFGGHLECNTEKLNDTIIDVKMSLGKNSSAVLWSKANRLIEKELL